MTYRQRARNWPFIGPLRKWTTAKRFQTIRVAPKSRAVILSSVTCSIYKLLWYSCFFFTPFQREYAIFYISFERKNIRFYNRALKPSARPPSLYRHDDERIKRLIHKSYSTRILCKNAYYNMVLLRCKFEWKTRETSRKRFPFIPSSACYTLYTFVTPHVVWHPPPLVLPNERSLARNIIRCALRFRLFLSYSFFITYRNVKGRRNIVIQNDKYALHVNKCTFALTCAFTFPFENFKKKKNITSGVRLKGHKSILAIFR